MKRQPRLSRSAVIARLRDHAARHGTVSSASLGKRDRVVLRSVHLYFPSLEAALRAARMPAAKTAPARASRRPRKVAWSGRRVIEELQRLDRNGKSTNWADLMQAGHGDLLAAATTYAGGLQRARIKAGVKPRARRVPVRRWNKASIVLAIKDRVRKSQTLASSKAPPRFVAAARWHFGNWAAALAAAGVEAEGVRLQHRPYTKPEILELLRRLARDGTVLRASMLKRVIKLDTVRRLFGSVENAIRAAGLKYVRKHPSQKWSRERLIEELRSRAKSGKLTLTRRLSRVVQRYFGSAHAARVAAGIPTLLRVPWTKESLIKELQRRAHRGDSGSSLWTACKRLFGSVAAARRAAGVPATQRTKGMVAWGKPELLAELQRRVQKRQQLGRGLTEGLRRQFGSLARARSLAGVPARRTVEAARAASIVARRATADDRRRWRRWSREQVIEKLRAWSAGGRGRLRDDLYLACTHHFGSVERACKAANLPKLVIQWTPARIRQALRGPEFDVINPSFVAACIYHFGSVTAARAAARRQRKWSKATVIAELQARSRRGLSGVGRLLRDPAVRLFGSTEAALRAAAQTEPRRSARRSRTRGGAQD